MSARIPHPNPELDTQLRPIDHCGFRRFLRLAACLPLALVVLSAANAQLPTQQIGSQNRQHIPQMDMPSTLGPNGHLAARRIRQLNIERQKELVSDSNDLLKLTMQLNAEVAKDGSSSLNPEQVQMLAKIEKLAKSVREKMSTPVQRNVFENNFPSPLGFPISVR